VKLSIQAWTVVSSIVKKIKQHPFIEELAKGTLSFDKFDYYSAQDQIYSQHHKACSRLLAQKASLEYQFFFREAAQNTMELDQKANKLCTKAIVDYAAENMSPSLFYHTRDLHQLCRTEPVCVGMAGLFPCYKIYLEVGLHLAHLRKNDDKLNPFEDWIQRYSSAQYSDSVAQATDVFDSLAAKTTALNQHKMLTVFYSSSFFELNFWDDSYYKRHIRVPAYKCPASQYK